MVAPATIALRDRRPRSRLLRGAIVLASAGELAADKYPKTPSRTEPAGLVARFTSSASVGRTCAGAVGGLLAGAAALGSAFATHDARAALGERTGVPDAVLGAAEDVLAILIATALTSRPLDPAPVPGEPAEPAEPAEAERAGGVDLDSPSELRSGPAGRGSRRRRSPRRPQ